MTAQSSQASDTPAGTSDTGISDTGTSGTEPSDAEPSDTAADSLRHNRDFTLLWTGQAVSELGTQISTIAYPLLVLATTGSAARAGLVGGASLIGTLLSLLPAGVVADRHSRRRVLVLSSLVQMAAVGSVVPAVLAHQVGLAHLMAVGLLVGAAAAFHQGASRGAIPRLVAPNQLRTAMSVTQARGQAAAMLGSPIGGVLFSLAQSLPFAADSLSFAAISVSAALLRDPLEPLDRGAVREPMRTAVTRGLRFVFAQPFLRVTSLWGAAVNAVAAGMMLMVIVIAKAHGASPFVIGVMVAVNAACGLAGSLLGVRLARRFGVRLSVLTTSWLLPACAVGIAYAPWVWLITVLGALTTFTIMPVNVFFIVRATRVTPDAMQAQAANARQLIVSSLAWLAPPLSGTLTDSVGVRDAILTAAALYLLVAIWLQGKTEMRELDES
ncbi:MAG TPA: MFS transporter [Actinocrinis sp.]|uniref:MFS transporter n=1 Tax=Actinocrinis sp. TaxID=1920516 RepID=UPI002DDD929A|nr:MFS transporter [Actinocrinis sp.]HEV2343143.1 MFS transporter [Actinocrinis sp.]